MNIINISAVKIKVFVRMIHECVLCIFIMHIFNQMLCLYMNVNL